jgi:hypothetical protein
MFGKSKDENDPESQAVQQLQRPAAMNSGEKVSTDQTSSISRGTDIFHRSLSIEENARFEGSSKREDNPADVMPHIPLRRPAAQDDLRIKGTAIEGNRKSNGTPSHDGPPIG